MPPVRHPSGLTGLPGQRQCRGMNLWPQCERLRPVPRGYLHLWRGSKPQTNPEAVFRNTSWLSDQSELSAHNTTAPAYHGSCYREGQPEQD